MTEARVVTPDFASGDGADPALRPETLEDFIGQRALRENLRIFVEAARARDEALDHVLFHGPPGLGKTTLAQIVAREMGVGFRATSGPVLARAGDLAAILTNLQPRDVLFIDEIHRLSPTVEEILYPAMEDFQLDLIIGEGPATRSVRIDLPHFTLVGATTRSGLITTPLRERFGIPLRLQFYETGELQEIVARGARLLGVAMTGEGAREIARRARGTPRVAGRLLRRVRDFASVAGSGAIDADSADQALRRLDVDERGLDAMDRRYLTIIADNYGGGPVGVETLASALSEQRDVLEDVIEPYLLQQGLLQRTPRGRMLTRPAFEYLGREAPRELAQLDLLGDGGAEEGGLSAAATDGWGRIDGTAHFYPVRVYYEDTDAGGIVYHANYLKFAERGRTEMLRLVGINHSEMATRYGLGFAVRSCSIEFRRAARLDDTLEVRSRLVELRGASIRVEQAILRGAEVIAELMLRIVCLQTHGERTHGERAQGRAARIPDPVHEILQPYVETREQD